MLFSREGRIGKTVGFPGEFGGRRRNGGSPIYFFFVLVAAVLVALFMSVES